MRHLLLALLLAVGASPRPFYEQQGVRELKDRLLANPRMPQEASSILRYVKQRTLRESTAG